MKESLIALAVGVAVGFIVGLVVSANTASADSVLPKGVTKFVDGDITCYVFQGIYKGGISCLKN